MDILALQPIAVLEIVAVALNVAYTLLIAWQKRIGWMLGFVASAISVGLYIMAHTWALSVLNAYYVGMAVYGWWAWGRAGEESRIHVRAWGFHAIAIVGGLLLSALAAVALARYLNGQLPRLDAFVTVFSFFATWLMARKDISCWYYFLVADSVAIYLNWRIGYHGFAMLNAMYLVLSVVGLAKWRQQLNAVPDP